MKNSLIYILGVAALMLTACGGAEKKKGFNPKDRTTTSMSIEERDAAIEAKRAEVAEVNIETLLSPHSIRMTVLPPAVGSGIDKGICEKVAMKLLQIASKNGISGVNGSSPIAFAAGFVEKNHEMTGSAPQKAMIEYEVTYYVTNLQTGDFYGSIAKDIIGVGDSFEDAAKKAIFEMKDFPELHNMISESEKRILAWYNENPQVIVDKVNAAAGKEDFGLALALINSVPEQATKCYALVHKMEHGILDKLQRKVAFQELAAMKDAIAAANGEYNPEIAAHLKMLPTGSKEAAQGQAAYDNYVKQMGTERMLKIAAEERLQREQMELEKIKMKYEYESTAQAAKSDNSSGFFSSAKTFFSGMAASSILSQVLSSCLFII